MCGIAGVVYRDGRPVDRGLVARMGACLRHRGPDDEGEYTDGGAGIAHTRLSIIDLSESGRQPMRSDDGRYVIAYNGEVYNFRELRQTLERCGHEFRGRSDTEVVLRAFIEWGESSFGMLEGMFALAVWDSAERRLHLVRDRFGIKPLYYHADAERLVFGSEIKALLASGEVGRDIDWGGLHEYLYYNTALGERTVFAGVRKLLPGHALTLDDSGVRVREYCSIFDVEAVEDDYATAVEKVRGLLERAVRDHLVSDVPVGVFLSGGIDSSAITAFAARHYRGRLKTFSAGFDFDRGVNELPKARAVAEHFGTDHHELHVSGGDVAGVMERLVRCHDQPFGDAANIPLFLLCEQLGDGNKVVLQGDGGDEVFGGYKVHSLMAMERWATLFARATSWARPIVPNGSTWARYYHVTLRLLHQDRSLRYATVMADRRAGERPARVFAPGARSMLEASDPFARYREFYHRFASLDTVQRSLYTDCAVILPDLFFEKVDKATMAHGVEVRVPLVDTRLAAYVMGLPAKYKVRWLHKKRILRRALRGVVPDEILDHPKVGFGVPESYWLRTTLAGYIREVLLDDARPSASLFDAAALRTLVDDHVEGRRDSGTYLYRLLNLALWYDEYGVAA